MPCFTGQSFLFLPNLNSSRLKFLSELVQNESGSIVSNISQLNPNTIVLINDSFVGEQGHLVNEDLFRQEFKLDFNLIWGYIKAHNLSCFRVSQVSQWLKANKFEILSHDLINLDPVENEQSSGQEDSESDTDVGEFENVEKSQEPPQRKKNQPSFDGSWSKNELLVKFLDILAHRYKVKGDSFRSRGYNLAKISIQRYPFEIKSGSQAQSEISNVGSSIARKIQTILDTGSLPGVYESPDFEKNLNYLSKCHNVGTYTARRWTNLGLRTFSDVAQRFPRDLQSDWPILFGWSYYQDWTIPIQRQECTEIWEIVRAELQLIDPLCQVEVQGSYVRGADQCGDVDMLFYKENCDLTADLATIMEELAIRLYAKGYVKCFLQLTPKIYDLFANEIQERLCKCHLEGNIIAPSSELVKKFYLGFKLPGQRERTVHDDSALAPGDQFMSLSSPSENICRRVDFFCCKWAELGASRLQWTGPKEFNRWLRTVAIEKGMKLTQHGLFSDAGQMLEGFDEKRIFKLLDEPYSSPQERNHLIKKRRCK